MTENITELPFMWARKHMELPLLWAGLILKLILWSQRRYVTASCFVSFPTHYILLLKEAKVMTQAKQLLLLDWSEWIKPIKCKKESWLWVYWCSLGKLEGH